MARNLQDCLAFASFKAQNGWQNRTLRSIEPEVTEKLKRKRPHSSDDMLSEYSSSCSDDGMPYQSFKSTQTITQKLLSRPGNPDTVMQDTFQVEEHTSRKRVRTVSSGASMPGLPRSMTWKQDHQLSQSSPVLRRPHTALGQYHPFSPSPAALSESHPQSSPIFNMENTSIGEEDDLPIHSFQEPPSSSLISSSPRTPSPARRNLTATTKQGGADLLLHFAYSPSRSPAINITRPSDNPPSTPPSQHTHLPSSVMNTPGNNLGLFNGALQTPGQNFNFADFVNVTPSPAQLPWGGRTPGALAKTPRIGKRGLNFDQLAPHNGNNSPVTQRKTATSHGLALQLGEELMPRS